MWKKLYHIYSEDNGRIILQRTKNGSCKAIIKSVEFKDEGEWMFLIEYKEGQNNTIKKNMHNINVRQNGKKKISSICVDLGLKFEPVKRKRE